MLIRKFRAEKWRYRYRSVFDPVVDLDVYHVCLQNNPFHDLLRVFGLLCGIGDDFVETVLVQRGAETGVGDHYRAIKHECVHVFYIRLLSQKKTAK